MRMGDLHLVNCMLVALHHKYLKDFCIFPGEFGGFGKLEPGAQELTMAFDEMYWEPPPPGFHPTPQIGFAKGLPGTRETSINGPGWECYPANAFLYAAQRGLPYVNDDPTMPMLAPSDASAKNNAKVLSAVLAMECVRLKLPRLQALPPQAIHELRERTREDVQPFRSAMLTLTEKVNNAIGSGATADEVAGAARFVAEQQVEPALEELRKILRDPGRHWTKRLVDFVGPATVLTSSTSTLPETIVKVLTAFLPALVAEADAQRKKQAARRSRLNFLLKLEGA
jgi:hypothetical protein